MLSPSNLKYDLLGESTQNLAPIVTAKDPDKVSFGAAVERAGWHIATDTEFFIVRRGGGLCHSPYGIWGKLSSGEEYNKWLQRQKQIYQKQSIRPTVG